MSKSKHDKVAEKIAKAQGTKYESAEGPDINTPKFTVEVEINKNKFSEGIRQLRGFKKPVYLGVPDDILNEALGRTKGTTIGVMNKRGKIVKRSTR